MKDLENLKRARHYLLEKAEEVAPTLATTSKLLADPCNVEDRPNEYVLFSYQTDFFPDEVINPEWKALRNAMAQAQEALGFPLEIGKDMFVIDFLGGPKLAGVLQLYYEIQDNTVPDYLEGQRARLVKKGAMILTNLNSQLSLEAIAYTLAKLEKSGLGVPTEELTEFHEEVSAFRHQALIYFIGTTIDIYRGWESEPHAPRYTQSSIAPRRRGRPLGSGKKKQLSPGS